MAIQDDYVLDLDKLDGLGGAMRSAPPSPDLPTSFDDEPHPPIATDDIDGPTDFTQNMSFWMNGGTVNKRHLENRMTEPEHPSRPPSTFQPTVEDYVETPPRLSAGKVPASSQRKPTPLKRPVSPSPTPELAHTDEAFLEASEASRASTDKHNAIAGQLSAQVQQLHRELETNKAEERSKQAHQAGKITELESLLKTSRQQHEAIVEQQASQIKQLRSILDSSRNEHASKSTANDSQISHLQSLLQSQTAAASKATALEAQLNGARADLTVTKSELAAVRADRERCNTMLSQSAEDYAARLLRTQEDHELEMSRLREETSSRVDEEKFSNESKSRRMEDEIERLRRRDETLTAENGRLKREKAEAEARISELELELSQTAADNVSHREDELTVDVDRTFEGFADNSDADDEDSDLSLPEPTREIMNESNLHLHAQIADLKAQLATATAASAAKDPQHDSEGNLDLEKARQQAIRDADSARSALRDLKSESRKTAATMTQRLSELQDQLDSSHEERDEALVQLEAFKTQWEKLRTEHATELKELRKQAESSIGRAVKRAARTKKQRLTAEDREEDALQQEAEARNEIEALRMEGDSQRHAAERAIAEKNDIEMQLRSLRQELWTLKADMEETNREVDRRIVDAVCQREEVWRDRMKKVVQERNRLGRALMNAWGREELGSSDPQAYQYRFVKSER